MKGKIVLIQFPFDDLSSSKVRPAYCLTSPMGNYQHVIFALITSRVLETPQVTDIVIDANHPEFLRSGLLKDSTIKLDHLVTLKVSLIRRELGSLSQNYQRVIAQIVSNMLMD